MICEQWLTTKLTSLIKLQSVLLQHSVTNGKSIAPPSKVQAIIAGEVKKNVIARGQEVTQQMSIF